MLRRTPDDVNIYTPGEPVFDPDTGQYVEGPPTLVAAVRGWFGIMSAEERANEFGMVEQSEAFALVPTGTTVDVDHLVEAGPTAHTWHVAGVEHDRGHVRVRLKR